MEKVPLKSGDSGSDHHRKSHGRARVSNGRDVLPDVDGRSLIARRYRDIADAIIVDQGGADQCSESRLQLVRRFAAASVLAELLEARLARGEQIDITEHATLSSTLVRLAAKIGIDRVAKDIGIMSLGQLVRLDRVEQLREAKATAESARAAAAAVGESDGAGIGLDTPDEPELASDALAADGHDDDEDTA